MKDDQAALGRVITALRADVLCVQEAPRFWRWRDRRVRLAASGGMSVVAGRRLGGVAVLTGPAVRPLHGRGRLLRFFPGLEQRAVAVAVVEYGEHRVAVGSVHLDLEPSARLFHARQALALLGKVAEHFGALPVLAGDVNEEAGEPAWRLMTERLADCYPLAPRGDGLTFPARGPRARIDAIFAAPEARVLSCGEIEADPDDLRLATDHLPVVAELALPGRHG